MTPRTGVMVAACGCLVLSCSDTNAVQRADSADLGNSPTAPSLKTGNVAGEIQTAAQAVTPSAQDFANTMAASDAFEMEVSKLAMSNSQSAAIKAFARSMVTAHTQASAELRKAVASTAATVTTLAADQQQTLDQLRSKTRPVFDQHLSSFSATLTSARSARWGRTPPRAISPRSIPSPTG